MSDLDDAVYDKFVSKLSLANISKFRRECLTNYQDLFSKINDIRIPKQVFLSSMNAVFSSTPSNSILYTLIFERFKALECTVESNSARSEVFSLKDISSTEEIDLYNITCAFISFSKSCFKDKMRFLFEITDFDDDGLINDREITKMIFSVNLLFCKEESQVNSDSRLICQSLGYIKTNRIFQMLMKYPGQLSSIIAQEHFISFERFLSALERIEKFKYEIIPFFANLKQCLFGSITEKPYQLKKSLSEEFISISTDLISSGSLTTKRDVKKTIEFKSFSKRFQARKKKESCIKKGEMNRVNKTSSQIKRVDYSKMFSLDVPPAKIKVISEAAKKEMMIKERAYLPRVGSIGNFRLERGKYMDNITQLKTYTDITNEINSILLKHSNEGKHINEIVQIKKRLHSDAGVIKRFLREKENYMNLKFSVLYAYMKKEEK